MKRVRRPQAGLTLTELMLSMAISSIVALAILGVQAQLTGAFSAQNRLAEAQQTGRAAADIVARDLKMAGFMVSDALSVGLATEGGVPRELPQILIRNGDAASELADTITIAYADPTALTTITNVAGNVQASSSTEVGSGAGFAVSDLVAATNQNTGCVMKLTSVGATQLEHQAGGVGYPWNTPANSGCLGLSAVWSDGTTQIAKLVVRSYRVRPNDPRGVLEVSPSGQVEANDWQELAQGVLDLQVAVQVREPGDGVDLDADGDPTLDWYSGDAMSTALDSLPLPAPQKEPMSARLTLVTHGGVDNPTTDTVTPDLCVASRPANNSLGDHCSQAISTYTDSTSRYYRASMLRKSSIVLDLRNLGTGTGTP